MLTQMNGLEEIETDFGVFYGFRDDVITSHLRSFGAHQRNELAMLLSLVRPGDVVLDIGANIGSLAIPLGLRIGPEGHVYAFEADDTVYEVLKKNIEANGLANIASINAIVSQNPGRYTRVRADGNMGATRFRMEDPSVESNIEVLSIDSWFTEQCVETSRVDLIKIDVEGMDVDVLQSSADVIDRFRPIVYMEIGKPLLREVGYSSEAVETMLEEKGYHFFRNTRPRNSRNDRFRISRLPNLYVGGEFFDLLAIHPDSDRYPSRYAGVAFTVAWFIAASAAKMALRLPKRFLTHLCH